MQIVIDIPEEAKKAFDRAKSNDLKGGYYDHGGVIGKAIKNGTPLPKHGRLIDADELELDTEWDFEENEFISVSQKQIDHADTIVSAEAESEENNGTL